MTTAPAVARPKHPLHRLLREAGISQGAIAKQLGVSRPKLAGVLLGYYGPQPVEFASKIAELTNELQQFAGVGCALS